VAREITDLSARCDPSFPPLRPSMSATEFVTDFPSGSVMIVGICHTSPPSLQYPHGIQPHPAIQHCFARPELRVR
jgi:hypothetical protein